MVIEKFKSKNKIFYFAHRGARRTYHENSIKAFKKAIELGCDGVEMDIQITKDRKIIIFHDFYITLNNKKHFISKLTHQEVISLCNSINHPPPDLFSDIIPLMRYHGNIIFNIEIKSETYQNKKIIYELDNIISDSIKYNQCIFSSFNPWVLIQLKFFMREKVFIGLILSSKKMKKNPHSIFNKLMIKFIKPHFLHPNAQHLNLELVNWAHTNKIFVNSYTVNSKAALDSIEKLGVDGIFTDNHELYLK